MVDVGASELFWWAQVRLVPKRHDLHPASCITSFACLPLWSESRCGPASGECSKAPGWRDSNRSEEKVGGPDMLKNMFVTCQLWMFESLECPSSFGTLVSFATEQCSKPMIGIWGSLLTGDTRFWTLLHLSPMEYFLHLCFGWKASLGSSSLHSLPGRNLTFMAG